MIFYKKINLDDFQFKMFLYTRHTYINDMMYSDVWCRHKMYDVCMYICMMHYYDLYDVFLWCIFMMYLLHKRNNVLSPRRQLQFRTNVHDVVWIQSKVVEGTLNACPNTVRIDELNRGTFRMHCCRFGKSWQQAYLWSDWLFRFPSNAVNFTISLNYPLQCVDRL